MQRQRGAAGAFHPAAHAGHDRVVTEQVRDQREAHGVHQRLLEHLVLEQQRMEHVAQRAVWMIGMSHVTHPDFRPLKVDVRRAVLQIGTLAVAPLGDIETLLQQSLREVVGVRDLGRDDGVAVGVEFSDVLLQAKLTDFVP